MKNLKRPEILAPAGSPSCLPAAVAGGADAVYVGLRHFNARGRAENFRLSDLADQVAYLHHHGLRCYVVLNTLLHDDELAKALTMAEQAHRAGIDAAIIQDLGLWRLLAQELPGLERHASTQMTIHDPEQISILAALGARRVITARELSSEELQRCVQRAHSLGVEIEHFVHGALCYAFSGQCLISNFAGCRSANRGTCAQNCRFEYRSDQSRYETDLSMKDLSLLASVPQLADIGVASFKIEGRLKSPDYVYTVSRAYRLALDAWQAGVPFDQESVRDQLRSVFARPFTQTPLAGNYDSSARVQRYRPQEDARPDGTLEHLDRSQGVVELRADSPPVVGTGYRFALGFYTDGFLVTGLEQSGPQRWQCRVRISRRGPSLRAPVPIFKNADHQQRQDAEKAMTAVPLDAIRARVSVDVEIKGEIGEPLTCRVTAADGRSVIVSGSIAAVQPSGQPLTKEQVRDKFGAFGSTGYALGRMDWRVAEPIFVPMAELKKLRREAVDQLEKCSPQDDGASVEWQPAPKQKPPTRQTGLWVAVSSAEAADAAREAGADQVWFEGLDLWSDQPPDLHAWGSGWIRHPATVQTSPLIHTFGLPVVAGQLGVLHKARDAGLAVIADAALNVLNIETLAQLEEMGVDSAVLSLEVSCREVARIAARWQGAMSPALVVHGRLPAMVTRQDHELQTGSMRQLTAHPREGGLGYELERRPGNSTVLWEQRRLCAPDTIVGTRGVVGGWVLELADLPAAGVRAVVAAYRSLLDGAMEPEQVQRHCAPWMAGGSFTGHLHQGSRELDRVLGGPSPIVAP